MRKSTKSAADPASDDYFDLVRRFPLRAIRSQAECNAANDILQELMERAEGAGLSTGQREYAEALNQLIGVWEDKHFPMEHAFKTPIALLKSLMDDQAMSTSDLGELLGSGKGQASMILNGKRELSKANIRVLAARFKVNAGAFL
jgi:antitoxin component HigA of HigAB toxin-antitoxin module